MSIRFPTIQPQAFQGTPQANPIKVGGIAGQAVPLQINWLNYGAATTNPNVIVSLSLENREASPLDQIRSVYIDNLDSDISVYVVFPDTQYTIAAKPNSEGWYPAFTNAKKCLIIGEGFVSGNIPQAVVTFANIYIQPSVNVELDTAISQFRASTQSAIPGFTQNFSPPALGDLPFYRVNMVISTAGVVFNNLWRTPLTGFIYLTHLRLWAYGFDQNGGQADIVIESTGISGTLFETYLILPNIVNQPYQGFLELINLQHMNIKIDASQTYRIRVANTSLGAGNCGVQGAFTTNPT